MIDWQLIQVGPDDDDSIRGIEEAFRESGLVVVPQTWYPHPTPNDMMGVPLLEILGRRRGGGGATRHSRSTSGFAFGRSREVQSALGWLVQSVVTSGKRASAG